VSRGTTINFARDIECAERIPTGVLAAAAAVSELLCARVRDQLTEDRAPFDPLRGLRLDSTDVEHLLARPSSLHGRDAHAGADTSFALPAAVAGSPLDVARGALGLSEFETAVIALCLLPELDGRYGPLIGYLHDDVKRKQPSVELALSLFAPRGSTGLHQLRSFKPQATLLAWQLVELPEDGALVRRSLQLERAFLWFLLGEDSLDSDLDDVARVSPADRATGNAPMPVLTRLLARREPDAPPVLLYGEDEQTCIDAAARAAATIGRQLLLIDGEALAEADTGPSTLRRCLREAVLKGWTPCIGGSATLLRPASRHAASYQRIIRQCPSTVFLVERSGSGEIASAAGDIVPVAVAAPRVSERLEHWRRTVAGRGVAVDESALLALAETTGLAGRAIEEIVAVAGVTALTNGEVLSGRHVQQSARSSLRRQATSLTLTTPRFGWDDLILPGNRSPSIRSTIRAPGGHRLLSSPPVTVS